MASKDIQFKNNTLTLSYEMVNPTSQTTLLILHGWGSNKELMKRPFGDKFPSFKHIYLDMPGFGKSPNELILTTHDYSTIVTLFLEQMGCKPTIIMGHSFGGKVATLLNPPCLILLSSSGVLVPKQVKVRIKIALFKILKPLKLDRLRQLFVSDDAKGMNQGMYETFKNVVNECFEKEFLAYKGKAILFWGKEDTATPLWSARKIAALIDGSQLYPLTGDHYFFLNHSKLIEQKIEELCKEKTL